MYLDMSPKRQNAASEKKPPTSPQTWDERTISVIIPTLNEEANIHATLQAVQDNKTEPDTVVDVTVVDGGSADGTLNMLKKKDVR